MAVVTSGDEWWEFDYITTIGLNKLTYSREPQPSFSLFTNLYHSLGNSIYEKHRVGFPWYYTGALIVVFVIYKPLSFVRKFNLLKATPVVL